MKDGPRHLLIAFYSNNLARFKGDGNPCRIFWKNTEGNPKSSATKKPGDSIISDKDAELPYFRNTAKYWDCSTGMVQIGYKFLFQNKLHHQKNFLKRIFSRQGAKLAKVWIPTLCVLAPLREATYDNFYHYSVTCSRIVKGRRRFVWLFEVLFRRFDATPKVSCIPKTQRWLSFADPKNTSCHE